jgi:DNA-binding CsgD family transcriptional regulator
MDDPGSPERTDSSGVDLSSLSRREREVLTLALRGLSARAIADELSLTEATVRSHLSHVYAKLDVTGRVELLARLNRASLQATPRKKGALIEHRRSLAWRLAIVFTIAMLGLAVGFVWMRPDLPASTDLATISRLVTDGHLAVVEARGNRLVVTTTDGQRLRATGTDASAVEAITAAAIAQGRQVVISADNEPGLLDQTLMAASALLPVGLVALLGLFVMRSLTRRPTPTGGSAGG